MIPHTALALVDAAVAQERDPQARCQMARLLGANLGTCPAARATLAALSKNVRAAERTTAVGARLH